MTNKTISQTLEQFAISIHEAKPGEDETVYFDQALAEIEQIITKARINEHKRLSSAIAHASEASYLKIVEGWREKRLAQLRKELE